MQDKREYWFHHVELWNNSGLSQAEYARQNQLSLRKLNYYKRLLLENATSTVSATCSCCCY